VTILVKIQAAMATQWSEGPGALTLEMPLAKKAD